MSLVNSSAVKSVSIHTPAKGVTSSSAVWFKAAKFQSTLPQREWRHSIIHDQKGECFNPHSHKGSDRMCFPPMSVTQYFNPHSHKGSDKILYRFRQFSKISIHTPTRGVTGAVWEVHSLCHISIHTPTRGVTESFKFVAVWTTISIHTPTRGVTVKEGVAIYNQLFQSTLPQGEWPRQYVQSCSPITFQSTLPQGEWLSHCVFFSGSQLFQSTLPQGEWHSGLPPSRYLLNFNPHSHKGSDDISACKTYLQYISIHTPTRGVTIAQVAYTAASWFQSTLPQGEWQFWRKESCSIADFNPHSHKGSDLSAVPPVLHYLQFQSTLPQGEWHRTET